MASARQTTHAALVQSRSGPGEMNSTLSNNLLWDFILQLFEQKLKNPSRNEEAISQSKVDGDMRLNLGGKKLNFYLVLKILTM